MVIVATAYGVSSYLSAHKKVPTYDNAALLAAAADLHATPAESTTRATAERFPFDPNTVSAADLGRLGLSERQAASFIKFRTARPFREIEELNKLYVLDEEQKARLLALAQLPEVPDRPSEQVAEAPPPVSQLQTFSFDPNTLPADSFQLLGFTEREAATLIKYRSYRDLTFHSPEDLLRVTSINQQRVTELLPLIEIALPQENLAPASPPPTTALATPVDVNTATVTDWQQLPGIGPYRAQKIVAFRERLGGFSSIEQVGDTYSLPDSTFQQITRSLTISPLSPGLYVNQMTADELARHPYLKRSVAKILVRYREHHGPFTSAEDLKKVRALTTENLQRLLPYLNFAP